MLLACLSLAAADQQNAALPFSLTLEAAVTYAIAHYPQIRASLERKAAAKASQPRCEGQLVKPEATFFHASVRASKLDCHPERVRFARQAGVGQ